MPYQLNPAMGDFVQSLPKTETHLHMEGALPFPLLQELEPERYREPPASWARDYKFQSFEQFEEELLEMALRWYTSPERYYRSASVIFQTLLEQNVKYVETSFHAGIIEHLGVPGPEILGAIRKASPPGIEVRVFLGMLRNHHNGKMAAVLDDCVNWEGLAGIDLHGVERLPIEPWAERLWKRAGEAGLERKSHAGEFGGAENVREAMELLGVRRIQHGIRAIENPAVVEMALARNATFDTCPISNVKLAVVDKMKDHPIRQLFDAGVRCTVSTDDPLSFGNRLNDEYEALSVDLFNKRELAQIARNGFEVALMDEVLKRSCLQELDAIMARN